MQNMERNFYIFSIHTVIIQQALLRYTINRELGNNLRLYTQDTCIYIQRLYTQETCVYIYIHTHTKKPLSNWLLMALTWAIP